MGVIFKFIHLTRTLCFQYCDKTSVIDVVFRSWGQRSSGVWLRGLIVSLKNAVMALWNVRASAPTSGCSKLVAGRLATRPSTLFSLDIYRTPFWMCAALNLVLQGNGSDWNRSADVSPLDYSKDFCGLFFFWIPQNLGWVYSPKCWFLRTILHCSAIRVSLFESCSRTKRFFREYLHQLKLNFEKKGSLWAVHGSITFYTDHHFFSWFSIDWRLRFHYSGSMIGLIGFRWILSFFL